MSYCGSVHGIRMSAGMWWYRDKHYYMELGALKNHSVGPFP